MYFGLWNLIFDGVLLNKQSNSNLKSLSLGEPFQCVVYLSKTHSHFAFTSHPEPPLWLTVLPWVVTSSYYLKKTHSTHRATDRSNQMPFDLSTLETTNTQSSTHILTITRRWLHLYLRVWTWGNISGRACRVGGGVLRLLSALTGGQWKVLIRSTVAVTVRFCCCGHLQLATVIK